ncbi:MAG: hypothetical protein ACXU9G_04035, partial [Syntrophales bacterium]
MSDDTGLDASARTHSRDNCTEVAPVMVAGFAVHNANFCYCQIPDSLLFYYISRFITGPAAHRLQGILAEVLNANCGSFRFHRTLTRNVFLDFGPIGRITKGKIMKRLAGKLFARIAAILVFMTLLCGLSACSWDKLYYANDPDPVKSITNTLGTPLWVEMQSDGSEKLV